MDLSLTVVAIVTLIGGGALAGLAWMLASARAQTRAERALREAETRASAATARAETLGDQARQAEGRANGLEAALRGVESQRAMEAARAEALARSLDEQRALLDAAKTQLGDTFQAMAGEALRASQKDFLALATEKFGAVRKETSRRAGDATARAAKGDRGDGRARARIAGEDGRAGAGDGAGARHGLRRHPRADADHLRDAGEAARRDRQPGDRAAGAGRARALGRDRSCAGSSSWPACWSTATSRSR